MELVTQTYLISDGDRVKIGRSANPTGRLKALQTGSPRPLKLLLCLPGDQERELHLLFASYRLGGEWFRRCQAIDKFVAEQTNGYYAPTFYEWLLAQRVERRGDGVQALAFHVARDPNFPRGLQRLLAIVQYFPKASKWRVHARVAHAEWKKRNRDGRRRAQERAEALAAARLPRLARQTCSWTGSNDQQGRG